MYFFRCKFCGEWNSSRKKLIHNVCEWQECQRAHHRQQWNEDKSTHLKQQRQKYRERNGLTRYKRECLVCGTRFTTWYETKQCCSIKCGHKFSKQQRRARKHDAFVEAVSLRVVFLRDGGRCQICGSKLNIKREVPHPLAPVRDHIVPLAAGGEHSYKNIQLVCFQCNSLKGDRVVEGGEQLRLC